MRPIHHTRSNEGVSPRRFSPSFSLWSYIGPCLRTMQLAYFLVKIAMNSGCSGAFLPDSEGQGPGAGCQSKREEASTQATWQCGSALFSCLFVLEVSFFSHRLLLLMEISNLCSRHTRFEAQSRTSVRHMFANAYPSLDPYTRPGTACSGFNRGCRWRIVRPCSSLSSSHVVMISRGGLEDGTSP
jgi:hypothetical protein